MMRKLATATVIFVEVLAGTNLHATAQVHAQTDDTRQRERAKPASVKEMLAELAPHFDEAARLNNLDPMVLRAIAMAGSSGKPTVEDEPTPSVDELLRMTAELFPQSVLARSMAARTCAKDVRDQAKRPENFEFGQPPMWKNFDAYVSPDGRFFNNARRHGETDGVFRFKKCLAEHGISLK